MIIICYNNLVIILKIVINICLKVKLKIIHKDISEKEG